MLLIQNVCKQVLILMLIELVVYKDRREIQMWLMQKDRLNRVVNDFFVSFTFDDRALSYLIGPGLFFILPCVDTYSKVDLRTVTFDVPPQEILTKDSVTVAVDAVVYFRIFNAVISITNVEDAAKSTKLLAATTLRNVNPC